MAHEDPAYRGYSASGIRSVEAWQTRGRTVIDGIAARVHINVRGQDVPLYTRDQTRQLASPRGPARPHGKTARARAQH